MKQQKNAVFSPKEHAASAQVADRIRIDEIRWAMKMNAAEGMHTFMLCRCTRQGFRPSYSTKCNLCYEKELNELVKRYGRVQ